MSGDFAKKITHQSQITEQMFWLKQASTGTFTHTQNDLLILVGYYDFIAFLNFISTKMVNEIFATCVSSFQMFIEMVYKKIIQLITMLPFD